MLTITSNNFHSKKPTFCANKETKGRGFTQKIKILPQKPKNHGFNSLIKRLSLYFAFALTGTSPILMNSCSIDEGPAAFGELAPDSLSLKKATLPHIPPNSNPTATKTSGIYTFPIDTTKRTPVMKRLMEIFNDTGLMGVYELADASEIPSDKLKDGDIVQMSFHHDKKARSYLYQFNNELSNDKTLVYDVIIKNDVEQPYPFNRPQYDRRWISYENELRIKKATEINHGTEYARWYEHEDKFGVRKAEGQNILDIIDFKNARTRNAYLLPESAEFPSRKVMVLKSAVDGSEKVLSNFKIVLKNAIGRAKL